MFCSGSCLPLAPHISAPLLSTQIYAPFYLSPQMILTGMWDLKIKLNYLMCDSCLHFPSTGHVSMHTMPGFYMRSRA